MFPTAFSIYYQIQNYQGNKDTFSNIDLFYSKLVIEKKGGGRGVIRSFFFLRHYQLFFLGRLNDFRNYHGE
jgi:hypothetical protein